MDTTEKQKTNPNKTSSQRKFGFSKAAIANLRMTLENFTITDNFIGLKFKTQYLDLHNCYNLEGFEYSFGKKEFRLTFRKGELGKAEDLSLFELSFKEVSFLRTGEHDPEMNSADDNCLEFIGFLPSDRREIMDGFLTSMPASPTDDMIINTYSGQSIKLQCSAVELIPLEKKK